MIDAHCKDFSKLAAEKIVMQENLKNMAALHVKLTEREKGNKPDELAPSASVDSAAKETRIRTI